MLTALALVIPLSEATELSCSRLHCPRRRVQRHPHVHAESANLAVRVTRTRRRGLAKSFTVPEEPGGIRLRSAQFEYAGHTGHAGDARHAGLQPLSLCHRQCANDKSHRAGLGRIRIRCDRFAAAHSDILVVNLRGPFDCSNKRSILTFRTLPSNFFFLLSNGLVAWPMK